MDHPRALMRAWLACNPVMREQYPFDSFVQDCTRLGLSLVFPEDPTFPPLLRHIPDPPSVLYVQGILPSWDHPCLAVVGTRKVTPYGAHCTEVFTKDLVKRGYTIVSGFMYGVDAIAHTTALSAQGRTIGVLGFGHDHMYPASHRSLASQMLVSGNCLMSEYPPWQPPRAWQFPARNRIVAGMCQGVLVIEAAKKSGTKITARLAAEYGRDVYAVPGPIDSVYSEGTKELVNLGATLVTTASDISNK